MNNAKMIWAAVFFVLAALVIFLVYMGIQKYRSKKPKAALVSITVTPGASAPPELKQQQAFIAPIPTAQPPEERHQQPLPQQEVCHQQQPSSASTAKTYSSVRRFRII